MRPLSPNTNKGRTVATDDVHHKTADQPKSSAIFSAKSLRHAARQNGKCEVEKEEREMTEYTKDSV